MSIAPFTSHKQLLDFAHQFVTGRISGFKKDINICLTADKNGRHAYFPALMTCLSVLDLLSGLFAGDLRNASLLQIKRYVRTFMDMKKYSKLNLEILHVVFRHKLAHHSHPYYVLDTAADNRISKRMRVTWAVTAGWRSQPIEIRWQPKRHLKKFSAPWRVNYDHRVYISIPHLRKDIIESACGPNGYLQKLNKSSKTRLNFANCITEFFPQ